MILKPAVLLRVAAFGVVCAVGLATLPARGEEAPRLRGLVTVDEAVVTLGDLFEGAGALADTAVFRAPDPGTTGTVHAGRVVQAARQHGLDISAGGIDAITVSRSSREISVGDMRQRIAERLAADRLVDEAANAEITLHGMDDTVHIEFSAQAPLQVRDMSYDRRSGRFSAILRVADSRSLGAGLRVSGRAVEVVETAVTARAVNRGETIGRADIAMQRMPRSQLRGDRALSTSDVIGMAARRGLRAGMPIGDDALMEPILVSRNEGVTILYRIPGLTLTVRGRAISAGARGDMVSVINAQSRRTIEAEVTGPGQVAVMAAHAPVSAMLATPR